jgi:PAS domain S-box-containing protein
MTEMIASTENLLRSRVSELTERVREHESLVRALQGGEVDAVVVLQKDGASIQRLRDDEPLYRALVETLPQSVATVLSDGTIIYANRQLAAMIGIRGEMLLGQNLLTSVAQVDHARFLAILQEALTAPQQAGVSFRWVGGETPALVSATRLSMSGVDAVGLVIMDVHDQVARQAAEEASRAKDELLASVSHELRTPLTAIMGWIQLLEIELADDTRHTSALRNLKNAVLAEARIVDDLLDLSRTEQGALPLRVKEFDVREILQTAASFVDLQAQNKAIGLRLDVPDDAFTVRGDPDRLRQVFVNLLSNAVKFTAEGEVELRARREDGAVIVDVIDSGMGIMSEFLPFVFEPFRRSERAQSFPGLGIGLAIARRLIEAHGGAIAVASDGPNRGATFTVRLPLV